MAQSPPGDTARSPKGCQVEREGFPIWPPWLFPFFPGCLIKNTSKSRLLSSSFRFLSRGMSAFASSSLLFELYTSFLQFLAVTLFSFLLFSPLFPFFCFPRFLPRVWGRESMGKLSAYPSLLEGLQLYVRIRTCVLQSRFSEDS